MSQTVRDDQIKITNLANGRLINNSGVMSAVKDNLAASAAPTGGDNFAAGWSLGSFWLYSGVLYVCTGDGAWLSFAPGGGGGSGDVVGPASAVDDAIATFDSTTGELIQDSGALIKAAGGGAGRSLQLGTAPPHQALGDVTPAAGLSALWSSDDCYLPSVRHLANGTFSKSQVLQNAIRHADISFWKPPGNGISVPGVLGMGAMQTTGNAGTANVVAGGSRLQYRTRLRYNSAATAGNLCGQHMGANQFARGTGTSQGFFLCVYFGIVTTLGNGRLFIGFSTSNNVPSNVEPNTITNMFGIAKLGGQSTFSFINNDGSGTATTNHTSITPTDNTLYCLTIFSPPYSTDIYGWLEDLENDVRQTAHWTTDLPATSSLLSYRAWRSNNTSATSISLDICSVYMERYL
jgi:hypothetical protein